jgi:hypothetical protein
MDSTKSSFAKLNGSSNYQVWSIKMRSYLIAQDLWDIMAASSTKDSAQNLKSQNSKAVSLIILSCEDHIIRTLDPNDFAFNIWKKLEKLYGQVGFSARHLAFQSLVSTSISSCDSTDHFIDQFRTNVNTLCQLTITPLPQWLLLSIFINNVASQYEPWVQSIMQQVRGKQISEDSQTYLDEVIASLIDESRRLGQNNILNGNPNTAMTAHKPAKQKPICKYCGKIHKSENCWQEFPEKRPSARLSSSNTQTNQNNQMNQPNHYPSQNIAFLSQSNNKHGDKWILDSGATQHMCNNKSLFTNIEPYNTTITIANNTSMSATGRGEVKLITQNGTSFSLINVLYVPKLASNLLSVSCATRHPKMQFNFGNGECRIMFGNSLLAVAQQHDSLLVLETIRPAAHVSKSIDTLTWHKRLGHLNQEYLAKTSIHAKPGDMGTFSCDTCLKNKSTRNISRKPVIKAKRPLEKIHSDLAGPITPVSLGGNKYIVTFTDDYSRFSWVFPCQKKSECLEIFKVFKKAVENEFNQKIAFLHCDNGGEYSSIEWKRFTQQEGIQVQYTVPYTPEQNGVAERLNRTLFNTARCFANDSPILTKALWAELIRTACYIKNRVPSSTNANFKSSYEMLFNRPPSIDHLRVIGSKCFSNKTGKQLGKLEERAIECLLVGYESENIYRVYDPSSRKVFRCRDLVIQESIQQDIERIITNPTTTSDENVIQLDNNRNNVNHPSDQPVSSIDQSALSPSFNQYHTAISFPDAEEDQSEHSSLDELADPQYNEDLYPYRDPFCPRAYVSRCLAAADSSGQFLPDTIEQAMKCGRAAQWADSMRDEIKSIYDSRTWHLVTAPKDVKIIQGRWVFRTKTDVNGKIIKYKSRWVVRGFQQEDGKNVNDTYASVVKPMSYKILFSIAASLDLEIEQMDVKTAFLNSPIEEDVYVEQPHGFELSSSNDLETLKNDLLQANAHTMKTSVIFPKPQRTSAKLVCKLDKALYGLKQAPRAWYKTLSLFMNQAQLRPLMSDYAVFGNQNRSLLVAVYVDDLLIFGKNKQQIQNLKAQLQNRFQMTDLGPAHLYLGMQITRDRQKGTLTLDQKKYIEIVLERFNMTECNSVATPMETGLKLIHRTDKASPKEINDYQKLIGCLEYAAMATRPDVTYSVHILAQFASNPDSSHYNAAKRVLRYLKGSRSYSLVFCGGKHDKFELFGFTDADWAGDPTDRKSIGGYCFYLNNSLISHMSKKQPTVALSTAEAEMHAALQASKEAIWLRHILNELGYTQKNATTIYCDNQAAISLSRNPEFHSRSKHVDIHYQFVRLHVEKETIILKFIRSAEMAADGLTKPLSREKHNKFCNFMQGRNILAYTE